MGSYGVDALPETSEEEMILALAQSTRMEGVALMEIVYRLLAVEAQHPELQIREGLHRITQRMEHAGADPMEDLRVLVEKARPFLER